jgi:hypothetical protein
MRAAIVVQQRDALPDERRPEPALLFASALHLGQTEVPAPGITIGHEDGTYLGESITKLGLTPKGHRRVESP